MSFVKTYGGILIALALTAALIGGLFTAQFASPDTTSGADMTISSVDAVPQLPALPHPTTSEHATVSVTTTTATKKASQQPNQRRAFSFHYLDVLEFLFAGKRDHATQPASGHQSPSTRGF